MSEKFALFLTEAKNQEELENVGLFSVTKLEKSFYSGVMRDIILENISVCELKKVV